MIDTDVINSIYNSSKNKLSPCDVYIEVDTGEIIAYSYISEINKVILSPSTIEKLNLMDSTCLAYLNLNKVEVKFDSISNKVYLIEYALLKTDDCDENFVRNENGTVSIQGYVFDEYRGIEVDNNVAFINTCKSKETNNNY